ncbi:MAG: sensor histidine kinase [Desulfurispora sp.]|uniref:sensor histidine kinase n=1 Tax=Desulfurispora sp. TaxID=3014275 RepID=UPI00404A4220
MITYSAVILLVIVVLALLFTRWAESYVYRQKQEQLLAAGQALQPVAGLYLTGQLDQAGLESHFNTAARTAGARVYLLSERRGRALLPGWSPAAGPNAAGAKTGAQAKPSGGPGSNAVFGQAIASIWQGQTVLSRKITLPALQSEVVLVGLPVSSAGTVKGVLLLASPLSEMQQLLRQIYLRIWLAALLALLPALALVYLVARRLVAPLKELQRAALRLAAGESPPDLPPGESSELADLAAAFNYMKNRLHRLEKQRNEMIAAISHELRTPLTSLRGFLQAMSDGVIDREQYPRYLQLAHSETMRLIHLVQDLMDLARLQSGNFTLQPAPCPVSQLLEETVAAMQLAAQEKQVDLQLTPLPREIAITCDRERLKQVLLNLLHNAIKFTPPGGWVAVQAGWQPPPGSGGAPEFSACSGSALAHPASANNTGPKVAPPGPGLVISVCDQGPGIPAEDLPFVFEKFYRAEKTARLAGGSGLGLAIAKNLVELHGGCIAIDSQPGRGTAVTVWLPAAETAQPCEPE